ncbi:hypothetical protein B0F90DRAFT_1746436, partial [Multifurca ochricompacta]
MEPASSILTSTSMTYPQLQSLSYLGVPSFTLISHLPCLSPFGNTLSLALTADWIRSVVSSR